MDSLETSKSNSMEDLNTEHYQLADCPENYKGILALAKLIAESYPQLHALPNLTSSQSRGLLSGKQKKVFQVVKSIWTHVENLPDYSKYEKYIDPLGEIIFNQQEWQRTSRYSTGPANPSLFLQKDSDEYVIIILLIWLVFWRRDEMTKYTPMIEQYLTIKADYPDAFLFV